MSLYKHNILTLLKHIAFTLVLISLLTQSLSQVISIFNTDDIELVVLDWEEESPDEEDKQEDDTMEDEEKIEPQLLNAHKQALAYSLTSLDYDVLESVLDFNIDILIPPPKYNK